MRKIVRIVRERNGAGRIVDHPLGNKSYIIPARGEDAATILEAFGVVMQQLQPVLSNCEVLGPPEDQRCTTFIEIEPLLPEHLSKVLEGVRNTDLLLEHQCIDWKRYEGQTLILKFTIP